MTGVARNGDPRVGILAPLQAQIGLGIIEDQIAAAEALDARLAAERE